MCGACWSSCCAALSWLLTVDSPGVADKQIALADRPAHLAEQKPDGDDKRLSWNPYWLTVAQGQVTLIEEQFVP
jgi:hypothetical protein